MTPIWRQHMRWFLDAKGETARSLRDILASARCFDMTAVSDLAEEVTIELRASASPSARRFTPLIAGLAVPSKTFEVDLTERACIPAPVTWLEWSHYAVLITSPDASTPFDSAGDEEDARFVFGALPFTGAGDEGDGAFEGIGAISIRDGHALVARTAHPDSAAQGSAPLSKYNFGTGMMFWALANLAILSSPSARAEPVEAHRGLAKRIKAVAGPLRREVIHTRVVIGAPGSRQSAGDGTGSPKAYHFCRAHKRRLPGGEVTQVRAHWRGDPAYGVRLPTYQVARAAA